MKPLAIDLFCGLGGWAEGLLAEGWDVVGIDIEEHVYGDHRYPAGLIVQDVRTVAGAAFSRADLIVASPPCQEYSYMAMPWTRAKAMAAAIRADETGEELRKLNELFKECWRIQREASEAKGAHIPLIVENVKGAIPWVGRSRWNFGSYHLWGDVPALMPPILAKPSKNDGGSGRSFQSASVDGLKGAGPKWDAEKGSGAYGMKRWTNPSEGYSEGVKNKDADGYERNHPNAFGWKSPRTTSSNTSARKFASAMIAKIPLPLSRHIARTFKPA